MALPGPSPAVTLEDYLELERATGLRHEWINGMAYAMAGGSAEHSRIKTNLVLAIGRQLEGSECHVADSDQRIRVEMTGATLYADAAVIRGPYTYASDDPQAVTNPRIVVEVLSSTTEDYDRGTKFQHYRRVPGLLEYVLASQDERRIEVRRRVEDKWVLEEHTSGALELLEGVAIPFDTIYNFRHLRPEG